MTLVTLIDRLLWIGRKGVVVFIFFLLACPVFGQVSKLKDLAPSGYGQWHNMLPQQISSDGRWSSYSLYYAQAADTLFISNNQNGKKISIPQGNKHSFSVDSKWCFAIGRHNQLVQLDLEKGTRQFISEVSNFEITADSKFLVYLKKVDSNGNQNLVIKNLFKNEERTIENVVEFNLNKSGAYLSYIKAELEAHKIYVYGLLDEKSTLIKASKIATFKEPVWSSTAAGLAFYEIEEDGNIIVNWVNNWKRPYEVKVFNPKEHGLEINGSYLTPPVVSEDNKSLFFKVTRFGNNPSDESSEQQNATVEIWNTKDEFLYPAYQKLKQAIINPKLTISWNIDSGSFHFLGDKDHSMTEIPFGSPFAYSYSFKDYTQASNDRALASEVLLFDVKSGENKSILEKPFGMEFQISPSGRYMSYFKEGHWWCYDAVNNIHIEITKALQHSFLNIEDTKNIPSSPYGQAGWTKGEAEILLYDKFDIWAITPDGKQARKITNGRSQKIRFRLYNFLLSPYKNFSSQIYDLNSGVIFKARSLVNENTGYFTFNSKNGIEKIIFTDMFVSNLRLSENGNSVIYTEERYNSPPRLMYRNLKLDAPNLLFQSNSQHFNYNWGKSELVYYNSQKDSLKGVLYYPSNFDPKIKYPMITYYYEEMSEDLHKYIIPSQYEEHGFNITNYTTQGYFVFCPDIVYEIGNPGISAVACITDGVNEVLQNNFIDSEKIGAYGHSWGGYETMFLITQTNMFATAVAGSGISDLRSLYLSMAWMWDVPQSWRFERYIFRFGKGYYEAREAYERNAPIAHAQNINTPLLSWIGKLDTNTNSEQTVELFLALRKLGKEHIMLLYENEGHVLTQPKNAEDLTLKMKDWFDYYLKGQNANWINEYH